uniref:SSD domain-containing protein n=1 Tax=Haptolina brevifila TaxID=156173 RepID=A0A7S2BM76_9EUKA
MAGGGSSSSTRLAVDGPAYGANGDATSSTVSSPMTNGANGDPTASAASSQSPGETGPHAERQAERVAWARRLCGVMVSALGAGATSCYVQIIPGARTDAVWAQVLGVVLLVHALPIASLSDAWYCGRSFAGYEPSDAPARLARKHCARLLLVLAVLFVSLGSAFLLAGSGESELASLSSKTGAVQEVPVENAEPCYLVWGVRGGLLEAPSEPTSGRVSWSRTFRSGRIGRYSAETIPGFSSQVATSAAQLDLAAACDALQLPGSPLNSGEKSEDESRRPPCVMGYLQDRNQTPGLGQRVVFPIAANQSTFAARLAQLLTHGLKYSVGFKYDEGERVPREVAWVYTRLHSKYSARSGESIGRPSEVEAYMHSWKSWFDELPQTVGANTSSTVLTKGFVSCRSWELYPTVKAFLSGVFRALVFTPLFCMAAVFAIVRDIAICYAALVSVVGMIIVTMGLLHLLGTPLGPIESLAIAVIIGVSIDYLIHLAFAYQNSLMEHRYYKSRAAMLARANSIISAALTTLCSVVPLMGAKLNPLRQFGTIFTIVTIISTVFALGFFNAFVMASGPLKTRKHSLRESMLGGPSSSVRDDANIQAAQLEAANVLGEELATSPFELHDDELAA